MEETVGLSYLEALTGKFVKVFKGGPESREGKLLAVLSDFIVIQTGQNQEKNQEQNQEQNQIVYFAIEHLKIVVANAKKAQVDFLPINDEELVYPATFLGVLKSLQTSCIQVNGGGPASKIGRVIDVKDEFLVLSTEKEGLVLYPISHIKSVTLVEQSFTEFLPEFVYNGTDTINGLLTRLVHNWVSISAGGPEKVEGILMEVADTYLIVVHHEELFYVPTDHVQFVGLTVKREEEKEEKEESGENAKAEGSANGGASNGSRQESSSSVESSSSDESSSSAESSSSDESSSSFERSASNGLVRGRRNRSNAFKQIWIENLIKASSQNIR